MCIEYHYIIVRDCPGIFTPGHPYLGGICNKLFSGHFGVFAESCSLGLKSDTQILELVPEPGGLRPRPRGLEENKQRHS